MSFTHGAPKFTGFIRRLVDDGIIAPEAMQQAILSAKKSEQDIVPFLIHHLNVPAYTIAEKISQEFGEPLFDLSTYNFSYLVRDLIEDKFILKYRVLPIFQRGHLLYLATSNPTNIDALDAIRFNSKKNIELVIVEHDKIEKAIDTHFAEETNFDFDDDLDLDLQADPDQSSEQEQVSAEDEAPIVKYINKLLIDAIRLGASDLHFEPYEKTYRVRYRIDGVLRQVATPPLQLATRLSARLKVMSQMDISEKRVPQDGRIKLKISKTKAIDFRVNCLPTLFGEKLVLRILDPSSAMLGIDALGYEPDQKSLIYGCISQTARHVVNYRSDRFR